MALRTFSVNRDCCQSVFPMKYKGLAGRRVLVTGGSRGIGYAIAGLDTAREDLRYAH